MSARVLLDLAGNFQRARALRDLACRCSDAAQSVSVYYAGGPGCAGVGDVLSLIASEELGDLYSADDLDRIACNTRRTILALCEREDEDATRAAVALSEALPWLRAASDRQRPIPDAEACAGIERFALLCAQRAARARVIAERADGCAKHPHGCECGAPQRPRSWLRARALVVYWRSLESRAWCVLDRAAEWDDDEDMADEYAAEAEYTANEAAAYAAEVAAS